MLNLIYIGMRPLLIITTLFLGLFWFYNQSIQQAEARGSLSFSGIENGEPLFDQTIEPGNCLERIITAQNDSNHKEGLSFSGQEIGSISPLDESLQFEVNSGNVQFVSSLSEFLHRAHPVSLGTVKPRQSQTIEIKLCLPSSAGNEAQQQTANFDLCFSGKKSVCFSASHKPK